ncbi:TerC family protein [Aquilutibacter rugosus]|uniref:TerC family protein n=1 Tax=Aquilutibacter rugosus TaxID=3115820 RepID=UPI002F4291B8
MEWLSDPNIWMGLATLVILEIVLGIDNLVFIAILADKLPPHQRDKARLIGLSLALLMRLGLLAALSWIMRLTEPLISVMGHDFSGRDLILLAGGLFLLYKATKELHERLEGPHHASGEKKAYSSFGVVVMQIVILDAVFSLDSVITAVGMVDNLGVMYAAVTIAMAVMLLASKPLTTFVNKHPTVVVLCLGFLLMIGFSLVAEGLGYKIPKGYLYAAIVFSILVEAFNQLSGYKQGKQARQLPYRQRTAEALTAMFGAREPLEDSNGEVASGADERLEPAEQDMIRSVLTLAERPVSSVMTVRKDLEWVDLAQGDAQAIERFSKTPHTRLLASDGELDNLQGVVQSRDVLAGMLQGNQFALREHLREPVTLSDSTTALDALERIREHTIPFGVVVDEAGTLVGIVTANDLLAAIAGDLSDTRDADFGATQLADGSWVVDASMSMAELKSTTGIELPDSPTYQSLSGLFVHELQRLPLEGDRIVVNDHSLTVESLERRRVGKAIIAQAQSDSQ